MYVVNLRKKTKGRNSANPIILFVSAVAAIASLFLVVLGSMIAVPVVDKTTNSPIGEIALKSTIPMFNTKKSEDAVAHENSFVKILLGFDPGDIVDIIGGNNAVLAAWNETKSIEHEVAAETVSVSVPQEFSTITIPENAEPIITINLHPSSNSGYLVSEGVHVKNSTTYNVDVDTIIKEPLKFDLTQSGPKVLIVHTHTSEAYLPTDTNYYNPSDPNRTEDQNYNVVRVGDEMTKILEDMGVEVIHDKTSNDYPSYNGSYKKSLQTVEWYLNQYPSIKVVIDVHRDALTRADNTRLKGVTTINGSDAAQVMLVVGTAGSGLSHPNWRENLKFAMLWQKSMDILYPKLTRAIDLRNERFNMHTTLATLILEVGSTGNTLEEAILGGKAAARALGMVLKDLK